MEEGRGWAPLLLLLTGHTPRGALASRAPVGLRLASGMGIMAGMQGGCWVPTMAHGPWWDHRYHEHGQQEMESSGSARTWQEMAGTD